MRDSTSVLVTNTTPLIAMVAATGSLDAFRFLYGRVIVPCEVAAEVRAGGKAAFGVDVFLDAHWLGIQPADVNLQPFCKIPWIGARLL